MEKPTIFFSHSSKDRDLILPIKNKIASITSGVMEIFMSSDGQSIPFGRNWVSKIEEGLMNAQIMFIFVTPNSISSEWIYFEAGYAYSKGIEVIPVGIGVNIGELKAPLNLLQGFDILSADGLNNFISIINKKFSLNFKEDFDFEDYKRISKYIFNKRDNFEFSEYFEQGVYELCSQYSSGKSDDEIIRYNIDKWYEDIKKYLDDNNISYANGNNVIMTQGIIISRKGEEKEPINGRVNQDHRIIFELSMYNFQRAFNLMRVFMKLLFNEERYLAIDLRLKSTCDCINQKEQLSSIVSDTEELEYIKNNTSAFKFNDKVNWWIFHKEEIGFSIKIDEEFENIVECFSLLENSKIIYKK